MRPLSATEAIGPAFERTRDFLARPFRWRTFFKLAAVAFFAELGSGFNTSFPSNTGNNGGHAIPPALLAFIVAFAVIIGIVSMIVGLILLYIGSRLQLVLVELVATRQTWVAPVWRRVSNATWRWIGLKLLFFFCILLVTLPLTIPVFLYFFHHAHQMGSGGWFSGFHLMQIILFAAVVIVVVLAITVVYLLIRDLALPYLSLEESTISGALGRLRAIVEAEPGQVALYVLLRFLLGIILGMAAEIAVFLVLLVSAIPVGLVGVALWAALHKAAGGIVVLIVLAVVAGAVFLCWAFFVAVCLLGSVLTFAQAYALYFLGGRYPLLGDLLDRSTPPPAYAYAIPPQYLPPQGPPPGAIASL